MRTRALTPLLNVADVAASLAWYHHLGFQEMRRLERDGQPVWALAGSGALRLMLNRRGPGAAAAQAPRGDVVLYLAVDDAHAAQRTLAEAGLAPGPVQRQAHGIDAFMLRDPDGHALALASEHVQVA
jgi:uncharacterized glyoxalase superfamily protein PhnB